MVRPGTYRVRSPSSPATRFLDKQVSVLDHDVTGLDITLATIVDVTGRVVVDGDGAPIPLFALLFVGEGNLSRTLVSTDGTLRIQLAAGEYRVKVDTLPRGYYVKSFVAGKTDLLQEPLKLTAGEAREIAVTLSFNPPREEAK